MPKNVEFGLEKGKVFPHQHARSLLNPLRRLVQAPKRAVRELELRGDESVLELGCGPGYFSPALVAALPRGNVVLYDLQPQMLEMARTRAPRAWLVAGDARALPFADASFDLVMMVAVLGEVGDAVACMREVRRTLRPSGRLTVSEVWGDSDYIDPAKLERMAQEAGLRLLRSRWSRLHWTHTTEFQS